LARFPSFQKEIPAKETATMAIVKRPPESVNRSLALENLSTNCSMIRCKFVDGTPDYVANFALGKALARDPEYRKWKASDNDPVPVPVEGIAKRSL
jgi:hypothetical protein